MNKNVILAIILVVAAGGYYQFSYKPAQEAKAVAAQAVADAADLWHGHQIDGVAGANLRRAVSVNSVQDWNLHGLPLDLIGPIRCAHLALGDVLGMSGLE